MGKKKVDTKKPNEPKNVIEDTNVDFEFEEDGNNFYFDDIMGSIPLESNKKNQIGRMIKNIGLVFLDAGDIIMQQDAGAPKEQPKKPTPEEKKYIESKEKLDSIIDEIIRKLKKSGHEIGDVNDLMELLNKLRKALGTCEVQDITKFLKKLLSGATQNKLPISKFPPIGGGNTPDNDRTYGDELGKIYAFSILICLKRSWDTGVTKGFDIRYINGKLIMKRYVKGKTKTYTISDVHKSHPKEKVQDFIDNLEDFLKACNYPNDKILAELEKLKEDAKLPDKPYNWKEWVE